MPCGFSKWSRFGLRVGCFGFIRLFPGSAPCHGSLFEDAHIQFSSCPFLRVGVQEVAGKLSTRPVLPAIMKPSGNDIHIHPLSNRTASKRSRAGRFLAGGL